MACEHCKDADGNCIYPYYGLRPYVRTPPIGKNNPDIPLPDNFKPDQDDPTGSCGTYEYCIKCGGKNE